MGAEERGLEDEILEWLKPYGSWWKVKVGRIPGRKNHSRGVPDILGVWDAGQHRGRFIAIEAKGSNARIRPEQRDFIDKVNESGGVGMFAWSLDDVKDRLSTEGMVV